MRIKLVNTLKRRVHRQETQREPRLVRRGSGMQMEDGLGVDAAKVEPKMHTGAPVTVSQYQ